MCRDALSKNHTRAGGISPMKKRHAEQAGFGGEGTRGDAGDIRGAMDTEGRFGNFFAMFEFFRGCFFRPRLRAPRVFSSGTRAGAKARVHFSRVKNARAFSLGNTGEHAVSRIFGAAGRNFLKKSYGLSNWFLMAYESKGNFIKKILVRGEFSGIVRPPFKRGAEKTPSRMGEVL